MKIGPILQRKAVAVATIILIIANLILQTHQVWAGNQFDDPIVSHPSAIMLGSGAWMDIAVQIPVNDDPNQGMGIYNWKLVVHSTDDASYYEIYKTSRDFYEVPERLLWNGGGYVKDEQGAYQADVFPIGTYEVYFEVVYTYFNIVNGVAHVNPELGETVGYTGSIRVVATEDELKPIPEPSPEPTITPTPTPEPTIVPSISPTPTPPPTPSPTPEEDVLSEKYAKLHPVLFIHGLNSYPELWRDAQGGSDYVSLLRDWGYPREYIALYSYTGEGVGMHGYNNQGHVPIVALGMYAKIKQLCEASIMHGGDGKVDIIAHSMGGLVARQFISEYPKNNCIDKVITIGTPFQGSWLLSGNSSQGFIDKKLNDLTVGQLAKLILGLEPGSYALTDMDLKSEFIQNLDLLPYNPSIEYSTIYGSIDTDIFMRLFNLELISKIGDVGDLVVSGFSASTVSPFQPSTKYKFSDTDRYRIPAYMQSISKFGFSIGFDFSTIGSLRYMHTEIYKQPEVKARILKILRNEI